MAKIDKQWVINRQGKDYVLYAGLLDLAHREGLQGISTTIVQVGDASNGHRHIVQAYADMGEGRSYSGIGDADPSNVSKMILPSALRMAETRAKARALRDAVNVAMVSIEELPMDEEQTARPAARRHVDTMPAVPEAPKAEPPKRKPPADDPVAAMKRKVADELAKRGVGRDEMAQHVAAYAQEAKVDASTVEGLQAVLDAIRIGAAK